MSALRSSSLQCWRRASLISSVRRALASKVDIGSILMPSLSPTMTQGTISSWKAKPGDVLRPGDILCEIETDKATLGFEIQDESVLAKILVEAHTSDVACGRPIALTVEDSAAYTQFLALGPADLPDFGSAPAAPSASVAPAAAAPAAPAVAAPVPAAAPAADTHAHGHQEGVLVSPAARFWIDKLHLDARAIKGTGKHGMIVKGDVINAQKHMAPAASPIAAAAPAVAAAAPVAAPAPAASTGVSAALSASLTAPVNDKFTDVPNTTMRKVIAKRLSESKQQVPHAYAMVEVEMDNILALRSLLKKKYEANISVNDFVIKAAALALRDMPQVNGKWDAKLQQAVPSDKVDISVAVATPSGLITPILFNAHQRGLLEINQTVKDLATRARDNKLKPEEFQGGSFSISNLGMFGVSFFTAVINPPQTCILAVGAGVPRVLPPRAGESKPRTATTVQLQLSADRRVVDEAAAAQFLQILQKYLSDTNALLL